MRTLSRLDRERAARRELEQARLAFERFFVDWLAGRTPAPRVFPQVVEAFRPIEAAKAALRAAERELMDPPPPPPGEGQAP